MSNLTVPNILSVSRIILAPLTIALHYYHLNTLALICFSAAIASDLLDGIAARWLNQETELGALIDPVADRLMAIVSYSYVGLTGLAPLPLIAIVLTRNISQLMSVPILIWWLKRSFKVKPKALGKWGTVASDFFLFFPLFSHTFMSRDPLYALTVTMMVVTIIEVTILFQYVPRLIRIAIGTHDTFE